MCYVYYLSYSHKFELSERSKFLVGVQIKLSQFVDQRLQSIHLVLYTESIVRTMAKTVTVQGITKKTLQKQFLENKMTKISGNELLRGEI